MTTSLLVVLAVDATQETLQEVLRIDMTALGREERGIYHIANAVFGLEVIIEILQCLLGFVVVCNLYETESELVGWGANCIKAAAGVLRVRTMN